MTACSLISKIVFRQFSVVDCVVDILHDSPAVYFVLMSALAGDQTVWSELSAVPIQPHLLIC